MKLEFERRFASLGEENRKAQVVEISPCSSSDDDRPIGLGAKYLLDSDDAGVAGPPTLYAKLLKHSSSISTFVDACNFTDKTRKVFEEFTRKMYIEVVGDMILLILHDKFNKLLQTKFKGAASSRIVTLLNLVVSKAGIKNVNIDNQNFKFL